MLPFGRAREPQGRRPAGRDRLAVRRGAAGVALDGRRRGAEPRDRRARHRLHDPGRDPDRRRDQPRQLGRARCSTATATWSASSRRSSPTAAATPGRGSRSRCRPSPCSGRSGSCWRPARCRYAWLGVATRPLNRELARTFKLPVNAGLLVNGVTAGGPAAAAGMSAGRAQRELPGRRRDPSRRRHPGLVQRAAGHRVAGTGRAGGPHGARHGGAGRDLPGRQTAHGAGARRQPASATPGLPAPRRSCTLRGHARRPGDGW